MADNIDYGKIPYEVQKQLKAVVPELMKLLQERGGRGNDQYIQEYLSEKRRRSFI